MGNKANAVIIIAVVAVIFLLIFTPFGSLLLNMFKGSSSQTDWRVEISTSPAGAQGRVEAEGLSPFNNLVSVAQGDNLHVEAFPSEGWLFESWEFDGEIYSFTPQITLSPQEKNSSHVLVALFEPISPTFQIRNDLMTTSTIQDNYMLYFKNNGEADISNIRIKLNDPYGVFDYIDVIYYAGTYSSLSGNIYTETHVDNFLNQYSYHAIIFNPQYSGGNSGTLLADQELYFKGGYKISPTIAAGTYELSFSIIFTVISGEFSEPPELTIPWEVSILG